MKRKRTSLAGICVGILAVAAAGLTWPDASEAQQADTLPPPVSADAYRSYSQPEAALGRLLFYDRVLSGNYRVACATCHNHDSASSDGEFLPGRVRPQDTEKRRARYEALVPPESRNTPALFNLGALEFTTLFHDGRLRTDASQQSGYASPAGDALPTGLRSVVAAQVMFPTSAQSEMALKGEDDTFDKAVAEGVEKLWPVLAGRFQILPEYLPHFQAAFPDITEPSHIRMTHIANAIAAFVESEWRADNSPFDAYLRGDADALSGDAEDGMLLFYGSAGCAMCHAGPFQTDHALHAMPRGDDLFRTPSLRNVAQTAPYGRAVSRPTLQEFLRLHQPGLQTPLTEDGISDLIAFLRSLTDEASLAGRLGKPEGVPSGLEID